MNFISLNVEEFLLRGKTQTQVVFFLPVFPRKTSLDLLQSSQKILKRTMYARIGPVLLQIIVTTTYVLLVRYTLKDGKYTYIQSSLVFLSESLKAFVALCFLLREKTSLHSWLRCVRYDVLDFYGLAEMSGLSLLFTIQNNLGYFAIGKLEAGLFQVNLL